ncbi:phosphotransferase family protein [Alteribacillus sp. HJP-4]|uniref:phosphotransferase family protein n=1 Tax=Alteribacillus sp. HJP-4 TaxID=2775394 RepID=UPI0035CD0BF9
MNSRENKALSWSLKALGPQAELLSVNPLKGGMSSLVQKLTVKEGERKKDYVLRLVNNKDWLKIEPDLALHEARALQKAEGIKVPAPLLVDFDEDGSGAGMPALLMTRIEGKVELRPLDMNQWIKELAGSLISIHHTDAGDFRWDYFTYTDLHTLQPPAWSNFTDEWKRIFRIVNVTRPETKLCFIHRDYHPANVLWKNNKVSGVVDWVNACRGPAGIDIGHCRWNLAMMYGVETADAFLEAYQSEAGEATDIYHPYWDILSLINVYSVTPPAVYPGWPAFGLAHLTDQLMIERMDRYMLSLLERWEDT